jgi:hypothetical protein
MNRRLQGEGLLSEWSAVEVCTLAAVERTQVSLSSPGDVGHSRDLPTTSRDLNYPAFRVLFSALASTSAAHS